VAASARAEAKRLEHLRSQYVGHPATDHGGFKDKKLDVFMGTAETGLWIRKSQRKWWKNGIRLTLGKAMYVTRVGMTDPVLRACDWYTLLVPCKTGSAFDNTARRGSARV
jgi:hypothetical protein